MTESAGEKTEPPSPKKIRDARAKGQVARSQEVVTTVSLTAVVATIWFTWNGTMTTLMQLFDQTATMAKDPQANMIGAIDVVFRQSISIILPILGVTILAAVAANYFQVGAIFALENLKPKIEKISPGAGFKRIFSMKQVVELLRSIAKIVFLSVLLVFVVQKAIGSYIASLSCGLPCQITITTTVLQELLLSSALAFVIVAGLDFMYQRHSYTKSLMMSKEEKKREYKESEGDPHIKGYRKKLARELLTSDAGQRARTATAMVVNPTHVAIALHYDPEKLKVPIVTAKGLGHNAHYLRTEAERAGVPVFRNVSLARALYATADVEEIVPDELFGPIAEVLVWVQKNRHLLYKGPLDHGVIDMDSGDHRVGNDERVGKEHRAA
jgi:type III secretion protein U